MPLRMADLVPIGTTAVLLAVLVSLGFWQLDRAAQKRALIDEYAARIAGTAKTLAEVRGDWQAARYQRVNARGRFLPGKDIWYENQVLGGRLGIHVYTPFRLLDGTLVLVNRGWWPTTPGGRDAVPPPAPMEMVNIEALLRPPPQVGIRIGSLHEVVFSFPLRIPYLDLGWLATGFGESLEPYVLLLADDTGNGGYVRDWNPIAMPPERHQGYALTWFGLAGALVVLFVVAQMKKRRPGED
ncbi:MAG: SURF1 family protein [Pseudomonadota bacterium]